MIVDRYAAHWWAAVSRGLLLLQHCERCDTLQHPPSAVCRSCHEDRGLGWREHDGAARLTAATTVRSTTYPQFPPPYSIGVAEIARGCHLIAGLPTVLPVGAPVQIVFRDWGGRHLPVIEPKEDRNG